MTGKNVSIDANLTKSCFKFVCEWGLFDGDFGTARVRKDMLGSLHPSLLTPTIPCYNIQSIQRELCVMGTELKRINDQKLVRLSKILFGNKGNN